MHKQSNYNFTYKKAFLQIVLIVIFCFVAGCNSLQKNNLSENLFVNDPALVTGTLDNGFKYVLLNNKKPEERVSMHLAIQSGSMNESDEQRGLAHYLEHMLFNGTEHFPPGELISQSGGLIGL